MRILKTTQTYYPYLHLGGPPAKVRGIARELVRHGHEVTVLTAWLGEPDSAVNLGEWDKQRGDWGWESRHDAVEAIYLPTVANYRATTMNPRVLSFCARRLGAYDVVHIYGLYDTIGSVTAWSCRRRGLPYVLEPLGMFGPKVRSQRKKKLYRQLVGGALFEGAAGVIATSETERAELIAGGIAAEKIEVRRNGLDLDEFQPLPARGALRAKLGIGENERLVLFLGRLSFIKGLDVLLRAFGEIADTHRNVRLVIAGPDDADGCREEILRLVEKLKLERRVSFPGPLYADQKLQALRDADLFVLPSQYESFGNAAAEAIACGLPVLVTKGCGIASLIAEQAGLVVDCTVEGLQAGLKLLLGDTALLAGLSSGCASIAQGLSWVEPVEQMERIYSSLIATKSLSHNVTVAHSQTSS